MSTMLTVVQQIETGARTHLCQIVAPREDRRRRDLCLHKSTELVDSSVTAAIPQTRPCLLHTQAHTWATSQFGAIHAWSFVYLSPASQRTKYDNLESLVCFLEVSACNCWPTVLILKLHYIYILLIF